MPPSLRHPPGPRRAFTLVEVLVVIGVITLLVAILLPVLGRARAAARDASCLSNLRSLATASLAYAVDNATFMPLQSNSNDPPNRFDIRDNGRADTALGRLIRGGYVGDSGGDRLRLFAFLFCPTMEGDASVLGDTILLPDRLGEITSSIGSVTSFGGNYNVRQARWIGGAAGRPAGIDFNGDGVLDDQILKQSFRLSAGSAEDAILADVFHGNPEGHPTSPVVPFYTTHRDVGNNAAYLDGSAAYVPNPDDRDLSPGLPEYQQGAPDAFAAGAIERLWQAVYDR